LTEFNWRPCLPPYERYLVADVGLFKNGDTGNLKSIFYDSRGKPRVSVFSDGQKGSTSKYFHIMMWEAFYGPVPHNHFILPVDGCWSHLELSNWELVSRATSVRRSWDGRQEEQDRLYEEAMSEFDDYIFGSCTESEEERRSRLQ